MYIKAHAAIYSPLLVIIGTSVARDSLGEHMYYKRVKRALLRSGPFDLGHSSPLARAREREKKSNNIRDPRQLYGYILERESFLFYTSAFEEKKKELAIASSSAGYTLAPYSRRGYICKHYI